MARWTCPECNREFGRAGQGHECAPAMTLDEYFSTGPPHERPIFEVVREHLEEIAVDGDLHVEPVSVGIFFKRYRTFAQLRPMTRWVALSFILSRTVHHPTMKRKVASDGNRHYHVLNIATPGDIDDDVKAWLTEAYFDDAP
jgi:hypothetical protein